MGLAPRTKILVAVGEDNRDRLTQVLEQGNARVRRIIDYLILIDGDLQHIARATGERLDPRAKERRAVRLQV